MKNLKIGLKFIITFGVIVALFLAVVITAISSLISNGERFGDFYDGGYTVTNNAMNYRRAIQSAGKNIGYATMVEDPKQTQEYINLAQVDMTTIAEGLDVLRANFKGNTQLVEDLHVLLQNSIPSKEIVYEHALKGENDLAVSKYFEQYYPYLIQANVLLEKINAEASAIAEADFENANSAEFTAIMAMIVMSVVTLISTIILAIYLTRSLTKPISEIEIAAKGMAEGHFNAKLTYISRDELGSLSTSMKTSMENIGEVIADTNYIIGELSNQNFTVDSHKEAAYVGDYAPMLAGLRQTIERLSDVLGQINQASDQVSNGADQVSGGAQSLSQGATEQASSIQELAATINEVSDQIRNTAENSAKASEQTNVASTEIANCNDQMGHLTLAIHEISSTSNEIGKIIKTIEDIAFQTNILALNAAVEAARAGAAGKGFAVVADEVRNLASKSAEAAKNTTMLIESAINAIARGTRMTETTATSLQTVVDAAQRVRIVVDDISLAANSQASSISQITTGVDQISSVVQTNSATAEESAAASEELSSQATLLKQLISGFKLSKDAKNTAFTGLQKPTGSTANTSSFAGAGKY